MVCCVRSVCAATECTSKMQNASDGDNRVMGMVRVRRINRNKSLVVAEPSISSFVHLVINSGHIIVKRGNRSGSV